MKIGFCGTMSVGKTTLVNALKKDKVFKDYKFATERSKYLNSLGIPLNTDSTYKGQIIFSAERAAELLHENMITDRTVIDVIAFSRLSNQMDLEEKHMIEDLLCELIQDYDIIFHIDDLNIPIEDNIVPLTRNAIETPYFPATDPIPTCPTGPVPMLNTHDPIAEPRCSLGTFNCINVLKITSTAIAQPLIKNITVAATYILLVPYIPICVKPKNIIIPNIK